MSDIIFTRLTSNTTWELPISHPWQKKNQGKKNIPYENQFGYGHEEWLFNPRYNINGFQYGYIRGLTRTKQTIKVWKEVHLYTVKKLSGVNHVFYVGILKNVTSLSELKEQKAVQNYFDSFFQEMIAEVNSVNGDVIDLVNYGFHPVVKFKMEDALLFPEPIIQPNFKLAQFKRFQPYSVKGSIETIFSSKDEIVDTIFLPGKASQSSVYDRTNKASSKTIQKIHSEIIEGLQSFLFPDYSLHVKNLSIEKTRFNGNIADLVTLHAGRGIEIYEIKTSASGRRNMREAIGQLLDYSLHSGKYTVRKIIIVSPVSLNKTEKLFLKAIQSQIKLKLEYLEYSLANKCIFQPNLS